MPRDNIKYDNTIIYKLVCKDVDITDCYIGHTTNFRIRKNKHKSNCNNSNSKHYNYYVYKFIRDNGGWDNWSMIEIEKFDATDKNNALKRERYYLDLLHATLNKSIPSRTDQEYKQDNKEKIKRYQSEKIKCELCGCNISRSNISAHKKGAKHINLMENKQ